MSRIILAIIISLFLLLPHSVFADETPEQMMTALIAKVKRSGSPVPIIARVDWKTAFAATLPEYRKAIGVKTPDELKAFYLSVFKNPNAVMKKKLASKMGSLPPEKQAALEVLMMRVETSMKERKQTERDRLRRSEFKVTGSKIEGNKATVDFEALLDGVTKTQTLELIKVDGQWRFPTLQWVKAPEKIAATTVSASQ